MNKLKYIAILAFSSLAFVACDHEENYALPEFLDGTGYGVLLHVDVIGSKAISIADVATASVNFAVDFEGDKRPVQSIDVVKIFTPSGGGAASDEIVQTSLTSFPANVSLSVDELVSGVPGLTTGALVAGDSFQIKFRINYEDGGVITRFGARLNPNFVVTFE